MTKKTLTLRADAPADAAPKPKVRVSPARLDNLHENAREMRRNPSEAEAALLARLANGALGGHRFKFKAVVGSAIVDFLMPTRKLAVEIETEGEPDADAEARRERKLAGLGLKVLRVTAAEVAEDCDAVVRRIDEAVQSLRPPRAAYGARPMSGGSRYPTGPGERR
jgi:very-short-patch-repair endonuclease